MKKLVLFSMAALLSIFVSGVTLSSCDGRIVEPEAIPNTSKDFLKTHFPECSIVRVETENDSFHGKEYDVTLDCNVEIDFNKSGDWTSVDCKVNSVPDAIVPSSILTYVKRNYPNAFITQISKERKGYEVELNNDIDLKFDYQGNFLRID